MPQPGKVLIVDDDAYVLLSIRMLLETQYTHVRGINTPDQIATALEENRYDVVVLDMNYGTGQNTGQAGLHWLQQIKATSPNTSVVLITAYGSIALAVAAMKEGAFDFVVKPWENEKLQSCVAAAYALSQSKQQVEQLKGQTALLGAALQSNYQNMIGRSAAMQAVHNTINKVAQTDANVLILGEHGTGKELAARSIHQASARSHEVFINVDMGAIAATLFESELFGHKKGAFTDAQQNRIGRFEAANGGTIFLDEIGNLSLPLQAKLLKVLQERTITRLGTNEAIAINVRIICATNIDLYAMVAQGTFRQDLLYRINTVAITLPPLRERMDDIPLLAEHFIQQYKKRYARGGLYVPDYVVKKLTKHHWPGNIRELQHAIERAVIMSDGRQLHVKDFSLVPAANEAGEGPDNYNLERLEKWAIDKALQKHHGNVSHAAEELGLSRGALYRRMEKYEL